MPLVWPRDLGRVGFTIDRERRPSRHAVPVASAHDEGIERAHLLVQEANRIVLGIV
jgi:hypothetical protein